MSINDLFCTPEQGKRLAELVPSIQSVFCWQNGLEWVILKYAFSESIWDLEKNDVAPALTLQELRDVANQYPAISCKTSFYTAMSHMTAPELAAWVIERLEETV